MFPGRSYVRSITTPRESTRRTILGSLFVHEELDRATFIGHRSGRNLELYRDDQTMSPDTFDDARRWLVEHQLVRWGQSGRPGERHFFMSLGPRWGYAIGIVLGHQSVRCGLGDARGKLVRDDAGEVLEGTAAPQLEHSRPDEVFGLVAELVDKVVRRGKVGSEHIRGATVALPAPVDLRGRLSSAQILRGFAARDDLRPAVREAFAAIGLSDIDIEIDNDANVTGAGEWLLRQSDDPSPATLITIKVSGGIGGAMVEAGGRVLRGATGAAGELGHLNADLSVVGPAVDGLAALEAGAPCRRCGGVGHLESYASAPAIADRVFGPDPDGDYGTRHVRLMNALQNPQNNDHGRACAAVRDAGALLGRALIPVVDFADPDLIVIAGRMRAAGQILTDAVQGALDQHRRIAGGQPLVVASQHGWSGVLGAIWNTLRTVSPPLDAELKRVVLEPLLRDMRNGPASWRAAAPLLGPQA